MNYVELAKACKVPVGNMTANWPGIRQNLIATGIFEPEVCMAVMATVAVETAWTFKPIHEYGSDAYLEKYDLRKDLGNGPEPDGSHDGLLYCGRGYSQLTGKKNYKHYGDLLGIDLIKNPDQALLPSVAAAVLVLYFKEHHIDAAARALNWTLVRKLVNGGTNGLQDFLHVINQLGNIWKDSGDKL